MSRAQTVKHLLRPHTENFRCRIRCIRPRPFTAAPRCLPDLAVSAAPSCVICRSTSGGHRRIQAQLHRWGVTAGLELVRQLMLASWTVFGRTTST
ncbi:hypothetical protein ABT009_22355 [Streptomyces sp. NPDC002896]|uniref:hypothetical protein n=1 Tax=Streptomyces sp. NPDC002896 TaxID=3154438 RepID=UPI003319B011